MKRFVLLIATSLVIVAVIVVANFGFSLYLDFKPTYPLIAIAILGVTLVSMIGLFSPLATFGVALYHVNRSWDPKSRYHRRYLRRLEQVHLNNPVTDISDISRESGLFLNSLYIKLDIKSNEIINDAAETVFYHTAISQSGIVDRIVVYRSHFQLIRKLANLYRPKMRRRLYPALLADIADALLTPSSESDVNLSAQIGPAIVGASVVGAIPGANLVSLLIAGAVVDGSANALATIRIGIYTRRYFHRLLEGGKFDVRRERKIVNEEALDLLEPLISRTSTNLSRNIWEAARDHLRKVPAATYESLKSFVTKSIKGIVNLPGRGKKGEKIQLVESVDDDL